MLFYFIHICFIFAELKITSSTDLISNISVIQTADCTFCARRLNLVYLSRKSRNSPSRFQKKVTKLISRVSLTFPLEPFGGLLLKELKVKKQLSTAKPLVKGFNFFKSGHVLYIGYLHESGKHYIKSQVLPSMKKDKVYTCFLVIASIGRVLNAHCKCPAGIDGHCNHVASTLFALEQHFKERQKTSSVAEDSCTSKPCKWIIPRKRKGPVTPISEISFVKHDYAKEKKAKKPKLNPAPKTCASDLKNWPGERLQNFYEALKEYQIESKKAVGWMHILPQKLNNQEELLISPIKYHPISA